MGFYCLSSLGNELIGNFSDSIRNVKLTLKEMSNFVGNQAVGGLMVMDMSSPGLLHSWSSSIFSYEVPPSLHHVSRDVSGYMKCLNHCRSSPCFMEYVL